MEIGNPKRTIIIHPLEAPLGRPKPIEAPAPELPVVVEPEREKVPA